MTETPETKKSDLKLFGDIDKRLARLGDDAKKLLRIGINLDVTTEEIELVRQIVERRGQLTPEGRTYADKQIGVDAPAAAE